MHPPTPSPHAFISAKPKEPAPEPHSVRTAPPNGRPLPAPHTRTGSFKAPSRRPALVSRPVLFGLLLTLTFVGAGLYLFQSEASGSGELTEAELQVLLNEQVPAPRSAVGFVTVENRPPAAALEVNTEPAGATVSLDGDVAGTTPFRRDDLAAQWYLVSLQSEGYVPLDTLIYLGGGHRIQLLAELSVFGSAADDPTAGNSNTYPETTRAAPAPSLAPDERFATGRPEAPATRPGYALQTSPLEASAGQHDDARAVTAPPRGTLTVDVYPWGSVYIDGELRARDTDLQYQVELPAGMHRVRVVHPELGMWEHAVEVVAHGATPVVVDLNRPGR